MSLSPHDGESQPLPLSPSPLASSSVEEKTKTKNKMVGSKRVPVGQNVLEFSAQL